MEISKEAKYFGEIFDLKCSLERNSESCMKKNEKGIEYCTRNIRCFYETHFIELLYVGSKRQEKANLF